MSLYKDSLYERYDNTEIPATACFFLIECICINICLYFCLIVFVCVYVFRRHIYAILRMFL